MGARIAVLVGKTGRGTNMINLIQAGQEGDIPAEVALVVSPEPATPAAESAAQLGVPVAVLSPKAADYSEALLATLADAKPDLICLAGYMTLLPPAVVSAYDGKILNVHPALLPKFGGKGMYGMRVHEAVVAAGEKESGATIHWVNEHYDEGAILLQEKCLVEETDTPETLAKKVLACEHRAYRAAIRQVLGG